MNCREIQRFLSAYADGELDDRERRHVEDHLSGCPKCRTMLAEYKKIHTMITSLRSPELKDIEEEIMSTINAHSVSNRRNILRPALAVFAVVALVATFTGLHYSGVFMNPEAVLVKAQSATESLRSFRIMDDEYIQSTETSELFHSWHTEIDYAGDGRLHAKKGYPEGYLLSYSSEIIVIDDQVYYTGNTSRALTAAEVEEIAPSRKNTLANLEVLANIDELPDETIDGVECFHYRGDVDIEKWLDQGREERLERFQRINENNEQGVILDIDDWLQSAEDMWRTRKLTYEFWISKDDYRIHRWKGINETPPGKPVAGGFYMGTWTFDYYDFNEEIIVEPPLDDSGELLPGWNSYTIEK